MELRVAMSRAEVLCRGGLMQVRLRVRGIWTPFVVVSPEPAAWRLLHGCAVRACSA